MTEQPRNEWAERAVIGGLMILETIPDGLGLVVEDFWNPQAQQVAAACFHLIAQKRPCDPISVRSELLAQGVRGQAVDGAWLHSIVQEGCTVGSLSFHASELRHLTARRDLILLAQQALQSAENPGTDPYDIAADLHVRSAALADRADPVRPEPTVDAADFVAGPVEFDFLIPGLLERGDRFLITGGEGSGKSVMTRQIAMCAAAGVHPFTGERFDPIRVLMVDLENGERHLRRALLTLWNHATSIGRPIERGRLTVESRPSGIDLTQVEDRVWLRRLCDTVHPELLVIGPLYRMHAADMNAEEPARLLTRTIDEIRAAHGCSIVMETHSPHGNAVTGTRSLRPVGSSLFMRWPEFGYGIRPKANDDALVSLIAWRGPRDERDFPSLLARGGPQEWPWAPATNVYVPEWGS